MVVNEPQLLRVLSSITICNLTVNSDGTVDDDDDDDECSSVSQIFDILTSQLYTRYYWRILIDLDYIDEIEVDASHPPTSV